MKTPSSKNVGPLVAPDDNRMLNDIYSEDELPNFQLRARPRAPRWAAAAQSQDKETTEPVEHPEEPSISEDWIQ